MYVYSDLGISQITLPGPHAASHDMGNILDESQFHKVLNKRLPKNPDGLRWLY